jgi:hypothetical protein
MASPGAVGICAGQHIWSEQGESCLGEGLLAEYQIYGKGCVLGRKQESMCEDLEAATIWCGQGVHLVGQEQWGGRGEVSYFLGPHMS